MPSAFELNASVKLDATSVNASAKQIQQALGRITGQASEFQKSLDASTARVFAFGATTAVLNGVSQSFKKLIGVTIEVEKRLVEINSIFKATDATFNRFRNSIFQVAKETGQAFGTVADGAAELARQGLTAEETATRLKAALVLTRISGLDAEKSVKALTAAINGFTSAGLTANQIVNKMVAVDTAFAVSTQDLAEAFSRAGSTAEDAGVSFDQLLGLVTAVEQKTARGGAVIGNAFKSIFTRLQRGGTIDQLKELGVEIDATQTGIQKLNALSDALENISNPVTASAIKELAGGVFQINVVSAALKDLGADTSVFASAARTAAMATNEAFSKNAELNKTISSQINALVVGLTSMAEKMGKLTFGPLLENLVGIATKLTDFLDKALDPEKGSAFIKGLFKTIGTFLGGPAVVIFTAAFVKIFGLVAKFAKDGLKSVFAIGSQSQKIQSIEGGIVSLLQRDSALRKVITSTTATQLQKEQAVITAMQTENALLTQQAALMRTLATAAAARGVTGFGVGGFTGKGGKQKFNAGFRAEEAEARMRGAPSNVRGRYSAGTIGGSKFIMNSHETEIPRFGRNGDSAVIPHYSGGFIPNYAGAFGTRFSREQLENNNMLKQGAGGMVLKDRNALGRLGGNKRVMAGEVLEDLNAKAKVDPIPINAGKYAYMVPSEADRKGAGTDRPQNWESTVTAGGKNYPFKLTRKFKTFAPDTKKKDVDKDAKPWNTDLNKKMNQAAAVAGARYGKQLVIPDSARKKVTKGRIAKRLQKGGNRGAYGAMQGAVGAVFEAATFTALGLSETSSTGRGDFDVRGIQSKVNLKRLFDVGDQDIGDLKVSGSEGNAKSFVAKIINENPNLATKYKERLAAAEDEENAAGGYIPNFNRRRGYGVRDSQIRIHRGSMGEPLAVTNTRDEPRGLRDAVDRERQGIGMAAGGFIPNYIESPFPMGHRLHPMKGTKAHADARGATRSSQDVNQLGSVSRETSEALDSVKNSARDLSKQNKQTQEETEGVGDQMEELAGETAEGGGKMAGLSTALIGASMALQMWAESVREANAETQASADIEKQVIRDGKMGVIAKKLELEAIQERAEAEMGARSTVLKLNDAVSKLTSMMMSLVALKMILPAGAMAGAAGGLRSMLGLGAGAAVAGTVGGTVAGTSGAAAAEAAKSMANSADKLSKAATTTASQTPSLNAAQRATQQALANNASRFPSVSSAPPRGAPPAAKPADAAKALAKNSKWVKGLKIGGAATSGILAAVEWKQAGDLFAQGSITRQQRDRKRGEAVGGFGGTLAGAAIGTAIMPVVGTIIGGIVGYFAGRMGGGALMGGETREEVNARTTGITFEKVDRAALAQFTGGVSSTIAEFLKNENIGDATKDLFMSENKKRFADGADWRKMTQEGGGMPDWATAAPLDPLSAVHGKVPSQAVSIDVMLADINDTILQYQKSLSPEEAARHNEKLQAATDAYSALRDSILKSSATQEVKAVQYAKAMDDWLNAVGEAAGGFGLNKDELTKAAEATRRYTEAITPFIKAVNEAQNKFHEAANQAVTEMEIRSKLKVRGPMAQGIGFMNQAQAQKTLVVQKQGAKIAAEEALRVLLTKDKKGDVGLTAEGIRDAEGDKVLGPLIKKAREAIEKANTELAKQVKEAFINLSNTQGDLIDALKANTAALPKKTFDTIENLAEDRRILKEARESGDVQDIREAGAEIKGIMAKLAAVRDRQDKNLEWYRGTQGGMADPQSDEEIRQRWTREGTFGKIEPLIESMVRKMSEAQRLIAATSQGSSGIEEQFGNMFFDDVGRGVAERLMTELQTGARRDATSDAGRPKGKGRDGKPRIEPLSDQKALLNAINVVLGEQVTEAGKFKGNIALMAQMLINVTDELGQGATGLSTVNEEVGALLLRMQGQFGSPTSSVEGKTLTDIVDEEGGAAKKAAEDVAKMRAALKRINDNILVSSISMGQLVQEVGATTSNAVALFSNVNVAIAAMNDKINSLIDELSATQPDPSGGNPITPAPTPPAQPASSRPWWQVPFYGNVKLFPK